MKLSCLLLAGGQSQRFGENKLKKKLKGQSLLEHGLALCRALNPQQTWLCGGQAPVKSCQNIIHLPDQQKHQGPTAALVGALSHPALPTGPCLVLAGDMPFVTKALLESMLARSTAHNIVRCQVAGESPSQLPLCLGQSTKSRIISRFKSGHPALYQALAGLPHQSISLPVHKRKNCTTSTSLKIGPAPYNAPLCVAKF